MTRRNFIGAGASAFFLASSGRLFGLEAPSNRVRLAIVGCREGGRGRAVLAAALKTPGVEVVALCDVDRRAREWAASFIERESGVKPTEYQDFRKLLEDPAVDGIISETPDHFHAYSAIMAMRAGKAVYVEKPCGYCPRECELIIKAQRETGQVFQMGNQRRSSLAYRDALEFLRQERPIGELIWAKGWYHANRASIGRGQVSAAPEWLGADGWDLWQGPAPRTDFHDNYLHYNWHWFRRWGTAETGNNEPHFADVARWALGVGYPARVSCTGGSFFAKGDDYEWPDTFNMSYEYPGGKFITFELTSHSLGRTFMGATTGLMVYGAGGSAYFSGADDVRVYDSDGAELRRFKAGGKTQLGSLTDPTAELDVLHVGKFVDCIRAHDPRTNAPADEAAMTSFMPLLANIALDTREPVVLDPKSGVLQSRAAAAHWAREYEKGWELT